MIRVIDGGGTLVLASEQQIEDGSGSWLYLVDELDARGHVIRSHSVTRSDRIGARAALEDAAAGIAIEREPGPGDDALDRLCWELVQNVGAGELDRLLEVALDSRAPTFPDSPAGAMARELASRIREGTTK